MSAVAAAKSTPQASGSRVGRVAPPLPAASLCTTVLPLGVETQAAACTVVLIAALALISVRNRKRDRALAHWGLPTPNPPGPHCSDRRPRVSAVGITHARTRVCLALATAASCTAAASSPPSSVPPPPSSLGSADPDGRRRFPHRTNLTAQAILTPQCNLPGRVGCVGVPRSGAAAHRNARFEHADCTLGTVVGCVRLPRASPGGGVLHGGGRVAFTSSAGFPGGSSYTSSIALGDVDGDGRLDAVVDNQLLLQQSDGSFVEAAGFPGSASRPVSIALGDVDGDGRLDVLYGNAYVPRSSYDNELLLQQSDGSFVALAGFPGGGDTRSVVLGDVDGDGRLDVLVGNGNGDWRGAVESYAIGRSNELLLQQSDGSFVASASFPGGSANTRSVALGDVDGDGRLDVLIGNYQTANELLLQQSDGSFMAAAGFPAGSANTRSVALGDVDGDGRLDVLVGNAGDWTGVDSYKGATNELLLQQSGGSFVAATGFPGGTAATMSVAMGDVDGDGRLDVLVGNHGGANELLLQQSDGSFAALASALGGNAANTDVVVLGDVDGDGRLDVLVGNGAYVSASANELLLQQNDDSFVAVAGFPVGMVDIGYMPVSVVALGDVDGDGRLDVLVGNSVGNHCSGGEGVANELLLQQSDSSFVAAAGFPGGSACTQAVALGDVNGDGMLDVVIGNHGNSGPNELLLQQSDGSFVAAAGFPGGSANTRAIALGDVNGDGRLDVLVGNHGSANELLLQQSDGSFVAAGLGDSSYSYTSSVALGDVDGDGRLDVLVGNGDYYNYAVHGLGWHNELLLQQTDGSFVTLAGFDQSGTYTTQSVALGDVNGDERLDILVGNGVDASLTTMHANELLLQQSDGSFVAFAGFPGGSAVTMSVALGDVNGDGRLDVLVGNYGSASELLLQQSNGSFVAAADYFPGDRRAQSVALGDVDGDGRLDVLLGSGSGNGNQLLILSPCPNGGAQSHANSACFACLPFMGRSSESTVCRECLPDRVSEGVFGSGERCVIPCSVGQRPLGVDTCTECTAVPGTYANASVERDPADPSTWAAPGCAFCPSGKRADSATGAVCLPCFPGQFASSTGSATCDVCPAGSYSAGFESTGCAPCPTSGYCSSPGAGDEALAFTPCAQPKFTQPLSTNTTISLSRHSSQFALAGALTARSRTPLVSATPRSAPHVLTVDTLLL